MSTAEEWMKDAANLADEVLEAGEGELVGMGDFGDVEFMVCRLFKESSFLAISERACTLGSGC